VAPVVRKPGASLRRSAIRVKFAAERGDLDDEEARTIADSILSFLSETERTSLSSRGDRFHTVPDLARFKREGSAYLRYANHEISARALIEITISPADEDVNRQAVSQPPPATDPEVVCEPTAVLEPEPASQATEVKTEVQLYDSDELYSQPAQAPPERQEQHTSVQPTSTRESHFISAPPAATRKRGPNRSWEDHRVNQSWESSFDSSSSSDSSSNSEPEQGLNVESVTEQPVISHTPVTPPRYTTQNLLSPTSGTVPSPLQVLFLSHSPSPNLSRLTSTPARRSSQTGPNAASNPIPSDLAARLQDILGDVQSSPAQAVEQLSELPDATRIVPPIDNSISLPDIEAAPTPVKQGNSVHSWNSSIPGTPSPEPFLYNDQSHSLQLVEPWKTVLEQIQRVEAKMDAATQAITERQDRIEDTLTAILELLKKQTPKESVDDAEKAKTEARAKLEAEKKQKLIDLENEFRTKYADAGLADEAGPINNAASSPERSKHPKPDLIGILNPLPAHKEWTGQAVDSNNYWVSFSKWLTHLEAVMEQKQSLTWKRACLDVAALTCLRGRALDWWHSLQPDQHKALREDIHLVLWNTLGRALHRNEQILKKEARDRKRLYGETLSEYAWKKFAMVQEAFGTNRPAADVISDIKEGLTSADQEIIQSDLHKKPTITRFMDELARLDKIRGPRYKSAVSTGTKLHSSGSKPHYTPGTPGKRQPLSETYDPKELKMRPNPLLPGKPAQWSYKFPKGKIIYLSSPCSKCGAKHFNFECKKDYRGTVARAAFMSIDSAWDERSHEQSHEDDYEEEDTFAGYMSIEPDAESYSYVSDFGGQRQIDSEPWSENAHKKEN
jgi:hypothetical protein